MSLMVCPVLQIITEYSDSTLPGVLQAVERMSQHLTAAVVSNDRLFQQQVLTMSSRRHG